VGFHLKYLLYLPDFNETHIWSRGFNQNPKYKIPQKSEQFFNSEGRTDRQDEVIASFAFIFRKRLKMTMKFQLSKSK